MIIRNLQSVSKTASHSQKYAIARKYNTLNHHSNYRINNTSIHSFQTIKSNICAKTKSHGIVYQSKHQFSKSNQSINSCDHIINALKQNVTFTTDKQNKLIQSLNYLQNSKQSEMVDLIAQISSNPLILNKATIEFLNKHSHKIDKRTHKNVAFITLSYIESTNNSSLDALNQTLKTSKNNTLLSDFGIQSSDVQKSDTIIHGYLSISSKPTYKNVPKLAKHLKSDVQSITIASLSTHSCDATVLKDVLIYGLSLEASNGGFHTSNSSFTAIDTPQMDDIQTNTSNVIESKGETVLEKAVSAPLGMSSEMILKKYKLYTEKLQITIKKFANHIITSLS